MYSISDVYELIDPRLYYAKVFGNLPEPDSKGEVLVNCPFHSDSHESLGLNLSRNQGGLWHCFGCGKGGELVKFHQLWQKLPSVQKAIEKLFEFCNIEVDAKKVQVLDQNQVYEFHQALLQDKDLLAYLKQERGLSEDTILRYNLGKEENGRVTIPIYNIDGDVVNFRRWLPEALRTDPRLAKCISIKGFGEARLFPIDALKEQDIIICEGEMDCLMLRSNGFNAITSTAGVNNFPNYWFRYFADKDVTIVFDNDEPGRNAANELLLKLTSVVKSIRNIRLAKEVSNLDITNIWQESPEDFESFLRVLIENTPRYYSETTDAIGREIKEVNLFQAANADLINKYIKVKARVAGKEDIPLGVPKKIRFTCNNTNIKKACPMCPNIISDGVRDKIIHKDSFEIIDAIFTDKRNIETKFKEWFQVTDCKAKKQFEVLEHYNVEEVRVLPHVSTGLDIEYTIRQAFYIGYGLKYNETYEFTGFTFIHPTTKQVYHIFYDARKIAGDDGIVESEKEVEINQLIDKVKNHLKVFQPNETQTVFAKLDDIFRDLETNVTKIIKRRDILRAIVLTYLSPIHFFFDGDFQKKGWMDTLIIGDTHCGKSQTMSKLKDFFGLGEVYSGENITKAGIIGGYISISGSNRTRFVLGVWPLNDRKLVCIDEFSGMSKEQIGELTMLRSDGIAESTKQAQTNKFQARVRAIMLSNPIDGRPVNSYRYGCLAVRDLIGGDADISRFDMILIAAGDEVSIEAINTKHTSITQSRYSGELFNLLIRWCWSRAPSQYSFDDEAVKEIYEQSIKLSQMFDSSLPIVVGASQRFKIARIAAAIATLTFSTKTGEDVYIAREHVEAAVKYLVDDFTKKSMAYHVYSAVSKQEQHLYSEESVRDLMEAVDWNIYNFLTVSNLFTKRDMEEATGIPGPLVSKVWKELVRLKCISKRGVKGYVCTPGFIEFLRNFIHPKEGELYIKPKELNTDIDEDIEDIERTIEGVDD